MVRDLQPLTKYEVLLTVHTMGGSFKRISCGPGNWKYRLLFFIYMMTLIILFIYIHVCLCVCKYYFIKYISSLLCFQLN